MLKKFTSHKINVTKYALFFLSWAPSHQSVNFDLQFLHKLKLKVHLSKTVCEIFYFQFRLTFIKIYSFVQQKARTLLTLKRHNSFQNKYNRKATHNFAPRPLIFKFQQVWKFNICVSWSSPKAALKTNFLNS